VISQVELIRKDQEKLRSARKIPPNENQLKADISILNIIL
jgi:hypothetical protein